jgi:FkbM family methyltransferase
MAWHLARYLVFCDGRAGVMGIGSCCIAINKDLRGTVAHQPLFARDVCACGRPVYDCHDSSAQAACPGYRLQDILVGAFALLLKNTAGYKNIKPRQAAISDHAATVSLQNVGDQSWAWETKESETGQIRSVTIPELLHEASDTFPLVVRIDIEGFEVELFRSNTEWARDVPLIVFESFSSGEDRLVGLGWVLCNSPYGQQ